MLTDPAQIKAKHRAWQRRIMVGHHHRLRGLLLRPQEPEHRHAGDGEDLGITKTDLGLFLTLHGVLYGVSKFVQRLLRRPLQCARLHGHRRWCSPRSLNVCFGFSSAVVALGLFWMINGWFQGMGFPPCARAVDPLVPPKELATKMSIWNTSHQHRRGAGGGDVRLPAAATIGNWRLCFLVPAGIAFVCAAFLWLVLPDTPPSVGLPEVKARTSRLRRTRATTGKPWPFQYVFSNPYIWLLAVANFFVYTIRYAMLDWGPTLLTQAKHLQLTNAGWMVAGFEISGMIGALLGGWLTDRLFGGRGFRACVFYMALAGVSVLLFWKVAGQSPG